MPIIAIALMLMSQRARLNGPVFVIGWLVGLAVIGVIVLAVAGPADASSNGEPATWVSVLKTASADSVRNLLMSIGKRIDFAW